MAGKNRLIISLIVATVIVVGCQKVGPTVEEDTATSTGIPTEVALQQPTMTPTERVNPLDIAPGEWVSLAQMQISRSEMTGETINGQIYIPGGLSGGASLNPSNALERYDPSSNTWVFQAILPKMRHHAATAVWDGRLYLFGGDPYSGRGPDAWYYDPATDAWTVVSAMPIRMVAGAAITVGEYIYLIGGLSHSTSEDLFRGAVQRYDPQQDQWEIVSNLPVVVNHCALVYLDGEIYVIGGRDASTDYGLVQIYNPTANSWREGPPLQRPRAGHAAVVVNDVIYVLGGERINSEDFSVLDSVEVFDPSTETWSYGVPMPLGLHGVPAVVIEGTIFVVGGSEQANGVANHGYLLAFRP